MNRQSSSPGNQLPAPGQSGFMPPAGAGSPRAPTPVAATGKAAAASARPLILRAVKDTSVGRARDHQEDTVEIFAPPENTPQAQKGQLLIVADGMGGHNAGEVASQMAVATIRDAFYADPGADLAANLRSAIAAANDAIFNHSRQHAGQSGMGTTVAMMVVHQNQVQIANVGDSRVYVVRSGKLTQVTTDHSWVEEQVRAGVLTPEQARAHPQRNIITRALGTTQKAQPDFFDGVLSEGDVFLLCSDGLTTHVSDAQIQDVLLTMTSLDQAANRLIQLANEGGGSDNISVIVARVEPAKAALAAPVGVAKPRGRRPLPLVIGAFGSLAGVALVAFIVIKILVPGGSQTPTPPATVVATTPPIVTTPPPVADVTLTATPTPVATATTETGAPPNGPVTATLAPPPTTQVPTRTPPPPPSGGAPETPAPPSRTSTPSVPLPMKPDERATGLTGRVRFAWDYPGQLQDGQAFEVRIWAEGQAEHQGAAEAKTALEQTIDLDVAPGIKANNSAGGEYLWAVAVIQVKPYNKIGRESEPRHFTYTQPPCDGDCER